MDCRNKKCWYTCLKEAIAHKLCSLTPSKNTSFDEVPSRVMRLKAIFDYITGYHVVIYFIQSQINLRCIFYDINKCAGNLKMNF